MLPHRGTVAYCVPVEGTETLATLVPPFAPLDAVGAPPERASILTPHTDLPLVILHRQGRGRVLFLPFQLSALVREYRLHDHYRLMRNCVDLLLGGEKQFAMDGVVGLQAMLYRKGDRLLVHLVNGIGQRPLSDSVSYHDLRFSVRLDSNETAVSATSVLAGQEVAFEVKDGAVHCELPVLNLWDMIAIDLVKK